jgi:hypothetical protein
MARYWFLASAAVALAFGAGAVRSITEDAGGGSAPTAAEYSASVLSTTSGFQREILKDGVVTFAEYEAAKQATIQCARDAGLQVDVRPAAGMRPSSYGISAPTESEMEAAKATLSDCERAFLSDVDLAPAHQGYTDAELAGGLAALNACLRADGGSELPELQSMAERRCRFRGCARRGEPEGVGAHASALFALQGEYRRADGVPVPLNLTGPNPPAR